MNEILDQPIEPNKEAKLHPVMKLFVLALLLCYFGGFLMIVPLPYGEEVISLSSFAMIILGVGALGLGIAKKNKRNWRIDTFQAIFLIGALMNILGLVVSRIENDGLSIYNLLLDYKVLFFIGGATALMIEYFDLFRKMPTKVLKLPVLISAAAILLIVLSGFVTPNFSLLLSSSVLTILLVSLGKIIQVFLTKGSILAKLHASAFLISFAMIFVGILAKVEFLPLMELFGIGLCTLLLLLAYELLLKDLITKN